MTKYQLFNVAKQKPYTILHCLALSHRNVCVHFNVANSSMGPCVDGYVIPEHPCSLTAEIIFSASHRLIVSSHCLFLSVTLVPLSPQICFLFAFPLWKSWLPSPQGVGFHSCRLPASPLVKPDFHGGPALKSKATSTPEILSFGFLLPEVIPWPHGHLSEQKPTRWSQSCSCYGYVMWFWRGFMGRCLSLFPFYGCDKIPPTKATFIYFFFKKCI